MKANYAAVEVFEDETPHEVIEMVMKMAVEKGSLFRALEVLGLMTIGTTSLLRFRTDCPSEIMEGVKTSRACIVRKGAEFLLFKGEETAPIDTLTVTQPCWQEGLKRIYRGPAVQFWERQFMTNVKKV